MAGIGVALSVWVWKNRSCRSKLDILCTLAIIVLILHVLEEWVIPGGLHYSYNISHGSTLLNCYPMNRLTDMITNFGGVVLGCIVWKVWGFKTTSALAVMLFSAFEVGIHVFIGTQDFLTFAPYGMNILYSPGLITSLFGFLPVSIALAHQLFCEKSKRPTGKQWGMAILAIMLGCFLLIDLPETLLGSENTLYGFTNRGYYERFAPAFEKEQGYQYSMETDELRTLP